jgi:hypothetical protein
MGIGGKAIPPFIDRITDVRSDAAFILLVEKEAAFMRIAEDRFYNRYPCSAWRAARRGAARRSVAVQTRRRVFTSPRLAPCPPWPFRAPSPPPRAQSSSPPRASPTWPHGCSCAS